MDSREEKIYNKSQELKERMDRSKLPAEAKKEMIKNMDSWQRKMEKGEASKDSQRGRI